MVPQMQNTIVLNSMHKYSEQNEYSYVGNIAHVEMFYLKRVKLST